MLFFFFFKQKTAYEMRISDWSSDVCSSDLERGDWDEFQDWAEFVSEPARSPEAVEPLTGLAPEDVRAAARLYATGGNAAIYYGLGVTEHSQGSSTVMAIANLAMATGNIGREGVRSEEHTSELQSLMRNSYA